MAPGTRWDDFTVGADATPDDLVEGLDTATRILWR